MNAEPLLHLIVAALAEAKLEAILIGNAAAAIQGAIDTNRGGMGYLSFLTPEQIAAIDAAY